MKKLTDFCNRITPRTWHITIEPAQFVFHGPGTLNILIRSLDHFIDGCFYAFKKGTMNFHAVSDYIDRYREARRSLRKCGDHIIGESEIWLYPDGCRFYGDNLYAATVHELAHVTVDRWLAFKCKTYRYSQSIRRPSWEGPHEDSFCRAFEVFIHRLERLDENPEGILPFLKSELNTYRRNISTGVTAHGVAAN